MSFTIRTDTVTCDGCHQGETSGFRSVLDAFTRGHVCIIHRPPIPVRPPVRPTLTHDHNTEREYRAHLRHGENPCDGCRTAHAAYNTSLTLKAAS